MDRRIAHGVGSARLNLKAKAKATEFTPALETCRDVIRFGERFIP